MGPPVNKKPNGRQIFAGVVLAVLLVSAALALVWIPVDVDEKEPAPAPSVEGQVEDHIEGRIEGEIEWKDAAFAPPKSCPTCHPKELKDWTGSHHDLAMEPATDGTVLGDFSDSKFTNYGLTTTFYKRDGKYFVRTDGPPGGLAELHDYEISYVFGVDPLQQYLIEFPDGRYQFLDIAWDTRSEAEGGERWFHLHPDEEITRDDPFHWTGLFLNWNNMCAECHSTDLKKNYDLESDTFKTSWFEIDVGCQGCHGPGSNHVAWAERVGKKSPKRDKSDTMGLEVDLGSDDSRVQVEACARCHSRRSVVTPEYRYGEAFMDHYVPRLLSESYYYPDGQILEEVYVYGSFIQSRKFHAGVKCTDCHDPHTAGLRLRGNALCATCHAPSPPARFATLKGKNYDTPAHHRHKQGSPGSNCVECHMPETKYMVVDPRRDHAFKIPRPDLSVKLGVPNPCTGCHTDKPAEWARDIVNAWNPSAEAKRKGELDFAEVIAAARANEPRAGPGLLKLAGDIESPAIVRATAINLLTRYAGTETFTLMRSALKDPDPLVRYEAVRGISATLPRNIGAGGEKQLLGIFSPLLKDPVRAVRTEGARVLARVTAEFFNPAEREAFDKAMAEFIDRQRAVEDTPEAHLNLGAMYQSTGRIEEAEESYKTSLRLAEYFVPVRFNLAHLYNSLGRNDEAVKIFRRITELTPGNGEAYYSLGLLLAEMGRMEGAAVELARAAQLLPGRARVGYNYSQVLNKLGKVDEAEREMLKAHRIDEREPGVVYALVILYVEAKRWEEALPFARKLIELTPGAPGPVKILEQIEEGLSEGGGAR